MTLIDKTDLAWKLEEIKYHGKEHYDYMSIEDCKMFNDYDVLPDINKY